VDVGDISVDVGPELRAWRADLHRFAEEIVFERRLLPHERDLVTEFATGVRDEMLPDDKLEALAAIARGLRKLLESRSN
jgi:hypothetical protein